MSDFLNKAKDAVEGVVDKIEDKIPESVKDTFENVKDKIEGLIAGHKKDDDVAE